MTNIGVPGQSLSSLFIIILALLIISCEGGLSPSDASIDPGFGGSVHVISKWPPADSLKDLRVIAFRKYPPTSILDDVMNGNAVFTDTTLALNTILIDYKIQKSDLSGTFKYIVVVQQFGLNIFADWRVVGVYSKTNDKTKPDEITVPQNAFLSHVDIEVDFYNLPPQPF